MTPQKANIGVKNGQIFSIIRRMTETPVPLLFWAGYSALVLVSSAYIRNWTVLVSESPAARIFPRRWYDISGCQVVDFWEAALRAVMGVIIFRPGISHVCRSCFYNNHGLTCRIYRLSFVGDFDQCMIDKSWAILFVLYKRVVL